MKQRAWVAGWLAVAASAAAFDSPPRCSGEEPRPETVALTSLLAQRDAEIADLKRRLSSLDEEKLYAEARLDGIVAGLEQAALSDPQRRRLAVTILREARANGIDPLLVVAVIRAESAFEPLAVSHVGALGLMQVMPATGQWVALRKGTRLRRANNLFDLELNVELGTSYLASLVANFGTVEQALVAYNAGPGAARKILANRQARRHFLQGYPRTVLREFERLKRDAEKATVERDLAQGEDVRG